MAFNLGTCIGLINDYEVVKNARNGVYGNINTVEIQMSCEHSKAKRDWLARFKGGCSIFLAVI